MKKHFNKHWVFIVSVAIIILPFVALLFALICLQKNIFDNADFWYGYMSYFGAVALAAVAMYQGQKTSELSKKLDRMNVLQNYSMARATKGCNFSLWLSL